MLHDGSKAVRLANKLTAKTLQNFLASSDAFVYTISTSPAIIDADRVSMFSLIEDNLKELYIKSSMGWDANEKREELFNTLSRFILVRNASDNTLLGYTSFRFEHEDDWDTIYCYEVHVSPSSRRKGLARTMMNQLVSIGRGCKMDKILLTVFKANPGALALYTSLGFTRDESCPDEEDVDYEILCYMLSQ